MLSRMLSNAEVRTMVPMPAAIRWTRSAFAQLGAGAFSAPRSEEQDGGLVVKSVIHLPSRSSVVKVLSVNVRTPPFVSGVVTYLDHDARSEIVADSAAVTTIRTGAIVGVATDLLAPPDSHRLVMIGAGAQAADQVRAVCAVRDIEKIIVVDRDRSRAAALVESLARELPERSCSAEADLLRAIGCADVICCATTSPEPLFDAADLPSRVHVNAIGAFRPEMRELPAELLGSAVVAVDMRKSALAEAGEVIDAVSRGFLAETDLIELADAIDRPLPDSDRTVFKTVGVAIQDWAVMRGLALALAHTTTEGQS